MNKSNEEMRLCELCCSKGVMFECAACGTARLEKSGPLLLCTECSHNLHNVGAFQSHSVVETCEKLWVPVKEKLRELAGNEAFASVKKSQLQSTVDSINSKYNEAVKEVKEMMDMLREAIDNREQSLIRGLTVYKEKLNSICQVAGGHLETFAKKADELKSKAETLRGLQNSSAVEGLLKELTVVSSRTISIRIPDPGEIDFEFHLKKKVSNLCKRLEESLVLPILMKDEGAVTTIQAKVASSLTAKGNFTAVKPFEESLRVISDSIKADIESHLIQPVFTAGVGDMCSVQYSGDGEWHRAKIIEALSKLMVKIYFVDYGNFETCSRAELMSLPGKYLMYPFQAIACSLTNDDDIEFSREARWMFSDLVLGKDITLKVISVRGIDEHIYNKRYTVEIKEPGSGASITARIHEEGNNKVHSSNGIVYHDIRTKSDTVVKASAEAVSCRPETRIKPTTRGKAVEQSSAEAVRPAHETRFKSTTTLRGKAVDTVTKPGGQSERKDTCYSRRDFQMLFVKGLPPEFGMDDVHDLFQSYGKVTKVIFDDTLPGRAWIVMEIKGALNAIIKMGGYKIAGGDPRGLLIDKTSDYYADPSDRRKARSQLH